MSNESERHDLLGECNKRREDANHALDIAVNWRKKIIRNANDKVAIDEFLKAFDVYCEKMDDLRGVESRIEEIESSIDGN